MLGCSSMLKYHDASISTKSMPAVCCQLFFSRHFEWGTLRRLDLL